MIVTTTINRMTPALRRYAQLGRLLVVGDTKTDDYYWSNLSMPTVRYIPYGYCHYRWPRLSQLIGPDCIQRRNFGFLIAMEEGSCWACTVDDDNEPLSNWEVNYLDNSFRCARYEGKGNVVDPLQVAGSNLWHRGFPLQRVRERGVRLVDKEHEFVPRIQANLWYGDPDVDAIERWLFVPEDVDLRRAPWFTSSSYMPFNSQNTKISREVLPDYFCFPGIGRMDDIVGAYVCQYLNRERGATVLFGPPSVLHRRHKHDYVKDFVQELWGVENLNNMLLDMDNWRSFLPDNALEAFDVYREEMEKVKS